jgi:hypothetical protein
MPDKDTFGLRLRRARERAHLSLDWIAQHTKVPLAVWEGMERNDFTRWPRGVFARACLREYATLVGLDPDEVVDEFCRWFPQGDRRAGNLIRAQAEILGVPSQYSDDQLPPEGDRRAASSERAPREVPLLAAAGGQPTIGAVCDLVVVTGLSLAGSRLLDASFLAALGGVAVACYSAGTATVGRTPAGAAIAALRQRFPHLARLHERQMHA